MLKYLFCALILMSSTEGNMLESHPPPKISLCDLINDVTEDLKPYQLVLIIDNLFEQSLIQTVFIKKCIIWDYPLLTIDANNLHILESKMNFSTFGSPRSTYLFVMLQTTINYKFVTDDYSDFCKVLNNYDKIWRRTIRPRWLMIYLNEHMNLTKMYEALMLHAWKKKFLDFTILELPATDVPVLHYYNPFTNNFLKEDYTSARNLFPNKLHDMYGYSLRTIFLNDPPTVMLEYNESGYVVNINSSDFWSLNVISEILNFTMDILPTFKNDAVVAFSNVKTALWKGEIDFSGNQLYLWKNEVPERSYALISDNFCPLVPILPGKGIMVQTSLYVIVLFILTYILIMKFTVKVLGFEKKYWSCLAMIQIVFGVTLLKQPRLLKERILFGCIILLSLFYLSNLYAEVTDIKLADKKISLETFQDLDKSGLIPLVNTKTFERAFAPFGAKYSSVKNLKRKSTLWENQWTCADQVIKTKVNFCVVSTTVGAYMVEKYNDLSDGKPKLRVMQRCFAYNFKGYAFAPATPYVEKFDNVLKIINEAGFISYWKSLTRPKKQLPFDKPPNLESFELVLHTVFTLGLGYSIALAVLFLEIVFNSICNRKKTSPSFKIKYRN